MSLAHFPVEHDAEPFASVREIHSRTRSGSRTRSRWSDPSSREAVLGKIVTSAEPVEVFGSLARCVVPELAVACAVSIVDENQAAFEVRYPLEDAGTGAETACRPGSRADGSGSALSVTARTRVDMILDEPGFSAVARFDLDPAREDEEPAELVEVAASLLLERAAQLVQRGRLEAGLEAERNKAENLNVALESNRVIGQAIGILMARHRITSEQAFDQLRTVSQHTHRKLRELAEDVVETGLLEAGPLTGSRALRAVAP